MTSSRAVILFRVRVPVLSEQIADVEPSVSTAGSRLTMALRRAISRVPIESSAVTTAGRPVGIAATARATPVMNRVSNDSPRARPSSTTRTSATAAMDAMIFDRASSCFCRGVLLVSVLASMSAMWPISVSMPVAVTISSPRPRVTEVFMYAMQVRSPSGTSSPGTGSIDLPTGRLSPVSAASSISRVAARLTRPSAGIRLPASTSTTSPGTSSSASISTAWPSRRTRAIVFIICDERLDALLGLGLLAQADHGVEDGQPGQDDGGAGLSGDDLVDRRPRPGG